MRGAIIAGFMRTGDNSLTFVISRSVFMGFVWI